MVNQGKVRHMARAEWYRQRERRRALTVNRYSKNAYVSLQVIKALIIATVGTVIGAALWILYRSEELLGSNDIGLVLDVVKQIAVVYGIVLVAAFVAARWRYSRIYTRSRASVKRYYNMLRTLHRYNEREKRRLTGELPPVRKEGEHR